MGHVSVHFAGAAGEEQDVAGQEEEQEVAGQEEQYEDLFQEAASYEEEEQERGRRRERRVSRRVASQSRSEERRRSLSEESSRSRRSRRSRSRDSRSRSRGRTRPRRAGHEHHRLTHRQNRLQTCVLCWRQGGRKGSKAIAIRPVTSKLAATLRALTHHKDYSEECTSHPAGICNTDLKKLLDLQKVAEGRSEAFVGRDPRHEWAKLKLVDMAVPDPDTSWDECECPMCHLGHFNPVGKAGNTRVKVKVKVTCIL